MEEETEREKRRVHSEAKKDTEKRRHASGKTGVPTKAKASLWSQPCRAEDLHGLLLCAHWEIRPHELVVCLFHWLFIVYT